MPSLPRSLQITIGKSTLIYGFGLMVGMFFAANMLVFWPGTMSMDSWNQWKESLSGVYSDWHPPLMAWWWGQLQRYICDTPGMLLLFHGIVFWSAISLIGIEIARRATPWLSYLLPLIYLTPVCMIMMGTLWKDTGMTSCYLLAFALILRSGLRGQPMRVPLVILTVILLFYGTGVRSNAIFAMPPLCYLLVSAAICSAGIRKRLCLSLVLFILFAAGTSITNRSLASIHVDMFSRLLTLQQYAMTWLAKEPDQMPEYFYSYFGGIDGFIKKRPYFFHDYTGIEFNEPRNPQEAAQLEEKFFETVARHPWLYLQYRIDVMKRILGLEVGGVKYSFYPFQPVRQMDNMFRRQAQNYFVKNEHALSLTAWPYVLLTLVVCIISFFAMRRDVMFGREIFMLSLSGLCYIPPYFILAPSTDLRYSYWTIFSGLIGLVMLLGGGLRHLCRKTAKQS